MEYSYVNLKLKKLEGLKTVVKGMNFRDIMMGALVLLLINQSIFYGMHVIGIAYYTVLTRKKRTTLIGGFFALIGLWCLGSMSVAIKYSLMIVTIGLLGVFGERINRKITVLGRGMIAAGIVMIYSVIFNMIEQLSYYQYLFTGIEVILLVALVVVFTKAYDFCIQYRVRRVWSEEELIAFSILLSCVLAGIADWQYRGIFLIDIVGLLLAGGLSFRRETKDGVVWGFILGIILYISGVEDATRLLIFGNAAILIGIFKELGKMKAILAYLIGEFLIVTVANSDYRLPFYIQSFIVTGFIFLIIPKKYLMKDKMRYIKKELIDRNEYLKKVQAVIEERLQQFSNTFSVLSKTLKNISDERTHLTKEEISKLFEDVSVRVCKDCHNYEKCWQSNFYDTYKVIFSTLEAAEKRGRVERGDIPDYFKKDCVKLDEFIKTTNRIYEIYRLNLSWENRIVESRDLVAQQLNGVSDLINNLAIDVKKELLFEDDLEKELLIELDTRGFNVEDVLILKDNRQDLFEAEIKFKDKAVKREQYETISQVATTVLQRKMLVDKKALFSQKVNKEEHKIKLCEKKMFSVETGSAIRAKEWVSGDTYSATELKDGKMLIAICDGMGTGEKARSESVTTIELLEQMLETGFPKELTVKMINSILVLKSNEDTFSTLDMGIIDLYSGIIEFIKIGGSTIFVYKSGQVISLTSNNLPVGMLNNISIQTYNEKLKGGDFIVMVSDGILDIHEDTEEVERLIKKTMLSYDTRNPKNMAEQMMARLLEEFNQTVDDDMSILITVLKE